MKYEMIFGDASLFDGAPSDSTHTTKTGGFYRVTEDGGVQYLSRGPLNGDMCKCIGGDLIAERRIIAEPKRWTVVDQKAGRLPEVGAEFKARGYVWECVRILNNTILSVSGDSYCGFDINECNPIESPEEKAARLRAEWCRKCTSDLYPRGRHGFPEMIYDALLSGELQAPKGER